MPAYDYVCPCGEWAEEHHTIGRAPRMIACLHCDGSMFLVIGAGVHIAPSALENKGDNIRWQNDSEREMGVDRPAYKRMRDRGLQPEHVRGSARLENEVADQVDIDYHELPSEARQAIRDAPPEFQALP